MKDIEQAYLAEQEYIEKNLGTTTNLLDLLNPYGYNTLDDYFGDRFLYLLQKKNIEIVHCLVADVKSNMFNAIQTGISGAYAPDEDITWALIGNPETFDYDKAKELGVQTCELGFNGGTIITCNSDFNITINLPQPEMNVQGPKFLNEFNKYLCRRGYNTHIDNNDLLLEDGTKIAGSVFITSPCSGNFSISIALNDHTELINQLCKKKSEKTPGFLTGITKQELEDEVQGWLRHT